MKIKGKISKRIGFNTVMTDKAFEDMKKQVNE